jgi:hypothetical protein
MCPKYTHALPLFPTTSGLSRVAAASYALRRRAVHSTPHSRDSPLPCRTPQGPQSHLAEAERYLYLGLEGLIIRTFPLLTSSTLMTPQLRREAKQPHNDLGGRVAVGTSGYTQLLQVPGTTSGDGEPWNRDRPGSAVRVLSSCPFRLRNLSYSQRLSEHCWEEAEAIPDVTSQHDDVYGCLRRTGRAAS